MKTLVQAVVLTVMSIGVWCTPAEAAAIFEQEACAQGNAPCETITRETNFPLRLRDIAFNVAKSGTAVVSLQGSMVCSSTSDQPAVVDLITQIVMSQNAVPVINGPGGARHAVVILPSSRGTTDSFNLASTRVQFIPSGQSVISFNVTSLRMDPKTSCVFYNLSFSVVFID